MFRRKPKIRFHSEKRFGHPKRWGRPWAWSINELGQLQVFGCGRDTSQQRGQRAITSIQMAVRNIPSKARRIGPPGTRCEIETIHVTPARAIALWEEGSIQLPDFGASKTCFDGSRVFLTLGCLEVHLPRLVIESTLSSKHHVIIDVWYTISLIRDGLRSEHVVSGANDLDVLLTRASQTARSA